MLGISLSLLAAILWGLDYVLTEIIFTKKQSIAFFLFVRFQCIALIVLCYLIFNNEFSENLEWVIQNPTTCKYLFISMLVALSANLLICSSIKYTNATYAGVVEITYPLFIVLFSYLLIKDYQIGWNVALGGLLIFGGVLCITLKK